jgi:hypothetical protein
MPITISAIRCTPHCEDIAADSATSAEALQGRSKPVKLALRYVQSESDRSNEWGNDNPDDARPEAHRDQADELTKNGREENAGNRAVIPRLYLTERAAAPKRSWQAHLRQTTDRRLPPVTKVICDLSADSMIRVELVGY